MDCWNSRRSPVLSRNGMCASNEPTASAIGAKILEAGGNAADAAVAIASALNVLQPNMCGLGGDSFALFYDAYTKKISCLQGNGASSANLTLERAHEAGFSAEKRWDPRSGMCVTVPGAAALWDDLVKTHGSLPLSQILSYSIKLAEEGFPISPITSATWSGALNAEGERVLRPHGRVPYAGEIIHNPDLAQTLRSIAEHGAEEGYYQGRVAEAVVAAVQAAGGVLDLQDLANHKTKFVQPISVAYKGLRIYETPPPSQGLAALIALRLIEKVEQLNGITSPVRSQEPLRFDANYSKRSSVDDTHLALECMRVACAEALHHITDPLVQSVPVEELLSDAFITAAAQKISTTTSTTVRATDYEAFQRGETAYFCAVDRHGNACSMISSNFQGFGTGIMPINCGFTLQNRGMNFSLQPGHPNQVMPNKRPYHTIIPAMVTYDSDNTLFGVMGCMGGFLQPMLHVQMVRNLLDCRLDPQQALDAPRWYLHGTGATQSEADMRHSSVLLEDGYGGRWDGNQQTGSGGDEISERSAAGGEEEGAVKDGVNSGPVCATSARQDENAVAQGLAQRGHRVLGVVRGRDRTMFGWGHVILRDPVSGVLWAGSEPRCDGCAVPAVL